MLVLTIGDPHFKENNALEMEEMEEKLFSIFLTNKIDLIVCLGDVLDRFEKISLFAFRRAILFLQRLSEKAKTYVLIGNHDRPNNSTYLTDEHPFLACRQWKNLVIVDNILQEGEFIFVPYVPPGRFIETLDLLPEWRECTAIFAHQELTGAKMGAIISDVEEWKHDYPLLVSGHIHDYQEVSTNLIYVGTPIQHGFHDTSDKGVSLFLFSKEGYEHKRIDLQCTKKQSLTIKASELETFISPKNVSLRLTVIGTPEELKTLRLSKKVKELRSVGVKVHFKPKQEKFTYRKTSGYMNTLKELIKDDPVQLKLLKELC